MSESGYLNIDNFRKTRIFGGFESSFFITNKGQVFSGGWNRYAQLGLRELGKLGGVKNMQKKKVLTPTKIKYFENQIPSPTVVQVCAGREHTLFLDSRGSAYSVGCNGDGQLGLGHDHNKSLITKINFDNKRVKIVLISCGRDHSVFLTDTKEVYSCGYNFYGQLGMKNNSPLKKVVKNPFLKGIVFVDGGYYNTLCIDEKGAVFGSGANNCGQLGLGHVNNTNRFKQAKETGTNKVKMICCKGGKDHCLFLDMLGSAYVAGVFCGRRNSSKIKTITKIPDLIGKKVTQISTFFHHSLFLTSNNEVWSSKNGKDGQHGWGKSYSYKKDGKETVQVKVPVGERIVYISAGAYHSLYLSNTGTVVASGRNGYGQLCLGLSSKKVSVLTHIDKLPLIPTIGDNSFKESLHEKTTLVGKKKYVDVIIFTHLL